MKRWQKVVLGILVFIGGSVGFVIYKNQPPQLADTNYYEYYIRQDTQPEGRIGVFISHLIMPEHYREEDFLTLAKKSLQYIPWPIRDLVKQDKGLLLLDKYRFYEFEEFTPTVLVDHLGSEVDIDGVPYIDKYHAGEIEWMEPGAQHLVGERSGKMFKLGDTMRVKVQRVDTETRKIDFRPARSKR